ncbi:hypothetical protein PUN28_014997 [Cardiocondyla obscurior]|uniref:Uncharacterized protein n=1 Tax=Cardiocondyla obscurior TaxID=286306 RepID=A0AAW2F053_9HYME
MVSRLFRSRKQKVAPIAFQKSAKRHGKIEDKGRSRLPMNTCKNTRCRNESMHPGSPRSVFLSLSLPTSDSCTASGSRMLARSNMRRRVVAPVGCSRGMRESRHDAV